MIDSIQMNDENELIIGNNSSQYIHFMKPSYEKYLQSTVGKSFMDMISTSVHIRDCLDPYPVLEIYDTRFKRLTQLNTRSHLPDILFQILYAFMSQPLDFHFSQRIL